METDIGTTNLSLVVTGILPTSSIKGNKIKLINAELWNKEGIKMPQKTHQAFFNLFIFKDLLL